jgi:hypothetical protein
MRLILEHSSQNYGLYETHNKTIICGMEWLASGSARQLTLRSILKVKWVPVSTAWRALRLRVEEMTYRYGEKLRAAKEGVIL